MDYKTIAVHNENRLKSTNERLKNLLRNAIVLLEDEKFMNCNPKSWRLLDALGMDKKEYEKIMEE